IRLTGCPDRARIGLCYYWRILAMISKMLAKVRTKWPLKFVALLVVSICLLVSRVDAQTIAVQTQHTSLVFKVDKDGELRQCYYGDRLADAAYGTVQMTPF